MRLLVAYDGSSCSRAALEELARAGLPRDTEALVVSVAEEWFPVVPPVHTIIEAALPTEDEEEPQEEEYRPPRATEEAQALALEARKILGSRFPGWQVSARGLYGSPARELIANAEDWKADLVVVGSHGRSGLDRLILGSVSQRVVTDAHCSVRISRPSAEEADSPVRLLIGIDGSPGAASAVRVVAGRAWPPGSEVRLVTSVDPMHMYSMEQADKFSAAGGAQEAAAGILASAGLRVSTLVKEADPKLLLIEEARQWGAESIFVGARGLGRLGRFFLGSISTAVSARAHCSVEVVRVPPTEG